MTSVPAICRDTFSPRRSGASRAASAVGERLADAAQQLAVFWSESFQIWLIRIGRQTVEVLGTNQTFHVEFFFDDFRQVLDRRGLTRIGGGKSDFGQRLSDTHVRIVAQFVAQSHDPLSGRHAFIQFRVEERRIRLRIIAKVDTLGTSRAQIAIHPLGEKGNERSQ